MGLVAGLISLPLPAAQISQNFLNHLMQGRKAAVIVSNPATGELMAVWNPQVGFGQAFPPGSTAKIVTSAAALEDGVLTLDDRIYCRRVPELLGAAFECSHPPAEGPFSLTGALANSCNYFFTAASLRLTSVELTHWYGVFGFGSAVEVEGWKSNAGEVRVPEDAGGKARAALGEETVTVTPAQLLLAYSAIATRGPVSNLWRRGEHGRTAGAGRSSGILRQVRLRASTFDAIRLGLEESVRSGMGHAAAVEGVRIAGKTGTATALDGSHATEAWFVGYAPAEAPEIAVVVFVNRGTGAGTAAPLAGSIFRQYFESKGQKP
jgi:cell division protein FtsI/penicillin-binding protein 2